MAITIELPADLERELRRSIPDLDQTALESLVVSLYRSGKLYPKRAMMLLGIDRWALQEVLKTHRVVENLPGIDEIVEDLEVSQTLSGKRDVG